MCRNGALSSKWAANADLLLLIKQQVRTGQESLSAQEYRPVIPITLSLFCRSLSVHTLRLWNWCVPHCQHVRSNQRNLSRQSSARPARSRHFCHGCPKPELTLGNMLAIQAAGADIIILGRILWPMVLLFKKLSERLVRYLLLPFCSIRSCASSLLCTCDLIAGSRWWCCSMILTQANSMEAAITTQRCQAFDLYLEYW